MNQQAALSMYRSISVQTRVEGATDHQLVSMLFEGLLGRVASAKRALIHGAIAERGENISAAISIVDGLRTCLNLDTGGEIAANLKGLYDFIETRLAEANMTSDAALLDEVGALMKELQQAWLQISPERQTV